MTEKPHEAHGSADAHGHAGDHGHGEAHGSPFIQHHYDDAQHQFDSGKLGIWLFLAQEVLFFSALFVAYILYRYHHPEIYSYAHKYLDVKYGAINTAVLIFSSLTAAWAVRCAQLNQRRGLILCIALTIGCACAFLGIKYIEYSHKVHEHILFGRYFDPCVSSGGRELLTRNNNCAGTKSTVVWDYGTGAPTAGCFTDIDQDPRREGVQADCTVKEYALTETPKRVREPKKDAAGKPVVGADGQPVTEEVEKIDATETFKRDLTQRCPEEPLPGHAETGSQVEGEGEHPGATPGKFPCWRPAYQPAVCKKGVGILVEYGDHDEREHIRIKAECKPPPKPADAGDLLADKPQPLELGVPLIQPRHQLTVHEQHELEAAGPPPEHTNMFFTIYFAMTGLHGIHVLFGVGVFTWLLIRSIKGHFTPDYFGPIDYAALYWHIVDLIWIFLFPLLYLIH
ncbi:MAG TPA: cytochrome c oxidase subunit 3 [Kofleriaceae bacterium]